MPLSPSHTPYDIQNHLYNAFLHRATTDVCLHVHATDWHVAYHLHRVVLIQSGFFRSLFTRGFRESSRRLSHTGPSTSIDGEDEVIQIHFDDPNITRPAFEICIARLYGGGPTLHVPPSLVPTISEPLTPHFLATPPLITPPPGQHPATPRFLLSLIATSVYLSIPSITSTAVSLILTTIGPSTVIRYLNFALSRGIGPLEQADLPCVIGLEEVGRVLTSTAASDDGASTSSPARDESLEEAEEAFSPKHGTEGPHPSPGPSEDLRFNYGVIGNKIGEAVVCWLARWATDILPYEEEYHASQLEPQTASASTSASTPVSAHHGRSMSQPPRFGADAAGPSQPSISTSFAHPGGRRATISTENNPRPSLGGRHRLPAGGRPPAIWSRNGGLDAKWVRGLISSDDLFIKGGEKNRYDFATRAVELRRREWARSFANGAVDPEEEEWEELFRTAFYYSHMSMDDLQRIQRDISPTTGRPYVSLATLQSAHWNQSVFRGQLLSMPSLGSPREGSPSGARGQSPNGSPTGAWQDSIGISLTTAEIASSLEHPTPPDDTANKTFFPVLPDGSQKFGGELPKDVSESLAAEAAGGQATVALRPGKLQGTRQLEESNFFGLAMNGRTKARDVSAEDPEGTARWTENEPCRFSVEFWGVESLKPSHRLYSNTFWCMGSLWNVYVQIVRKKGPQLGVYLQRQSFVDSIPPHSVPYPPTITSTPNLTLTPSTSLPSFPPISVDRPSTPVTTSTILGRRTTPWAIPHHAHSTTTFSMTRTPTPAASPPAHAATFAAGTPPGTGIISLANPNQDLGPHTAPSTAPHSPYRDPRQSIRAYFSISCPSATGSSSTKFCSAPDCFNVTQSWGWRSSKAEEWVDLDAGAMLLADGQAKLECSLRATIVLGVV